VKPGIGLNETDAKVRGGADRDLVAHAGRTPRWLSTAPEIGRRRPIEPIEVPDDSLLSAAESLLLSCAVRCGGRSDGQVGVHDSLPTRAVLGPPKYLILGTFAWKHPPSETAAVDPTAARKMIRRNFEGSVVRWDSEKAIGLSGGDRHVGAAGP
jgi:hypothetical protein